MVRTAALVVVWWGASVAAISVPPTSPSPRPADESWAVARIIDGDTIDIEHGGVVLTVRLIGINAPEADECWGTEATEAITALLDGGPVWLDADVSEHDEFGRLLRYVTNPAGDDVGAVMIASGDAIARSYPPDVSRDGQYAALQADAESAGLGLWASDACSAAGVLPLASSSSSIAIEVHPNARGDDTINLNDEWVRFTNTGPDAVDITGWMVKDTSSSHRYTFGPLVLASQAAVTLHTGCGTDTATDRYWCNSNGPVWNNGGDTAFLTDPAGDIVVSYTY